MKHEDRETGWISVNTSLPGFYTKVQVARKFREDYRTVDVFPQSYLLTQHGDWTAVKDGKVTSTLNLHEVGYWKKI